MRYLLSLLLLLSASAHAQGAKFWQLDIVTFERIYGSSSGNLNDAWKFQQIDWPELLPLEDEHLPPNPDEPPSLLITGAAAKKRLTIRPASSSSLDGAVATLKRTGRYKVITSHSLRFPQKISTPQLRLQGGEAYRLVARDTRADSESSVDYWMKAPDLAPPIAARGFYGWARLDHQVHPILTLDLSLQKVLPGVFALQQDPSGTLEYYRDQVQQYRMIQDRRLRPGVTAYFDHPRMGVLARLIEIEAAPAPDKPATPNS